MIKVNAIYQGNYPDGSNSNHTETFEIDHPDFERWLRRFLNHEYGRVDVGYFPVSPPPAPGSEVSDEDDKV